MAEQRANLAITTLAADIVTTPVAGTSESWLVASTALPFPQTGTYRATVGPNSDTSPEIVLITAVVDTTHFQVQRGAESSTIKAHTSGDAFQHTLTAGALALAAWTDRANTWTTGAQDLTAATSLLVPASAGAAPTTDGSLAYDTTQDAWNGGGSGALSGAFGRVLSVQRSTTDTLINSTTAEQNFATTFTLPANYLIASKALRVTAMMQDVVGAGPPTHVYRLKFGSTVLYSQATASTASASSTRGYAGIWMIVGTAAPGAAVSVETQPLTAPIPQALQANSTVQPVAVATNASQVLTVSLQFGATGSQDSVTLRQLIIEELN